MTRRDSKSTTPDFSFPQRRSSVLGGGRGVGCHGSGIWEVNLAAADLFTITTQNSRTSSVYRGRSGRNCIWVGVESDIAFRPNLGEDPGARCEECCRSGFSLVDSTRGTTPSASARPSKDSRRKFSISSGIIQIQSFLEDLRAGRTRGGDIYRSMEIRLCST